MNMCVYVCRCPSTHSGERCEHLTLTVDDPNRTSPEEIISICLGVVLLLACLTGAIYCFMRKRYAYFETQVLVHFCYSTLLCLPPSQT